MQISIVTIIELAGIVPEDGYRYMTSYFYQFEGDDFYKEMQYSWEQFGVCRKDTIEECIKSLYDGMDIETCWEELNECCMYQYAMEVKDDG